MNAQAIHTFSARQLLCLAASILGLMFLAYGVAPGTVLASSATDVYTEEPPPPTPTNNGNNNNGGNKSNGNTDSNDSTGSSSDGSDYSGGSSDTDSSGSTSDDGSTEKPKLKQFSDGNYNPATDSDKKDKSAKKEDSKSDDSTAAVPTSGDGDDGDGGSSLPLIIAILIGVPLIGVGGYYAWARYRSRGDDETRDRLKSALSGGKSTGS
jgi:hypothetical protein